MKPWIVKQTARCALAVGVLGSVLGQSAVAATVTTDFSINVTLASQCTASTVGSPALNFGTYTAFGAAANPTPTTNLTFDCTRGLNAPTFSLDTSTNGTSTQSGEVGGDAATGNGVLADVGLNYGLSIAGSKTTTGTAPTTAAGNTGTADVYTFVVTGSMPANQAGTCPTGNCTNTPLANNGGVRTLTVTY